MDINPTHSSNAREHLLRALLIDALHHRLQLGQTTALRDLHGMLEVPQPIALQLARQLETEGVVLIEPNLADAFASEVTLSARMVSQLETKKKKEASR